MPIRIFDMGKNYRHHAKVLEDTLNRMGFENYLNGRIEQFVLDLAMTGRAVMPDGSVTELFSRKDGDPMAKGGCKGGGCKGGKGGSKGGKGGKGGCKGK
jgi:hypothetical protein